MTEFEQWAPAFANPLSSEEMESIERIAVMWSQIDHYTDRIIMSVLKLKPKPFSILIAGRMFGSKLQLLRDILGEIPNDKASSAVSEFRDFPNELISDRKTVFHGLWMVHTKPGGIHEAKASKRSGKALAASAIKDLERRTARATVLVARAERALTGEFTPPGQTIHITMMSMSWMPLADAFRNTRFKQDLFQD